MCAKTRTCPTIRSSASVRWGLRSRRSSTATQKIQDQWTPSALRAARTATTTRRSLARLALQGSPYRAYLYTRSQQSVHCSNNTAPLGQRGYYKHSAVIVPHMCCGTRGLCAGHLHTPDCDARDGGGPHVRVWLTYFQFSSVLCFSGIKPSSACTRRSRSCSACPLKCRWFLYLTKLL